MLNLLTVLLYAFALIGAAVMLHQLALTTEVTRKAKDFLVKWSELLTIPLAFVLWSFSGDMLRLLDPTAATFDAGIFQTYLLAIIGLLIFHGFVRLLMKHQWPKLDGFLDNHYNIHFNGITSWQKLKLSSAVFFLLLFALVLLAQLAA